MKKVLRSLGVALAITLGGVALSASPLAPVTPKAQAASYVSCYKAMNGETWCWRYNCTWFETHVLGCYTGWYRTNATWWS